MLSFERVVKASDSDISVYVFTDPEKGHTVYLSHTGTMSVVEAEHKKTGRVKAAGFAIGDSSCSSCDGC